MNGIMRKGLFLLFVWLLISCDKSYQSSIPDYPVSLECNLITDFSPITTSGQFLVVTKTKSGYLITFMGQPAKAVNTQKAQRSRVGFGGLVIGNSTYNGYCAFDAACPVESNSNVIVSLKKEGLGMAECPKCGTIYDLNIGGVPIEGEGKERLKNYRTVLDPLGAKLIIAK